MSGAAVATHATLSIRGRVSPRWQLRWCADGPFLICYAVFQKGITAGICGRRNGYRSNCAAKFLNWPCLAWVTSRYSGTRPEVIAVRSHLLQPEQALQFARVVTDRLHYNR